MPQVIPLTQPLHNGIVSPLLTDYYQITMAYAYWHAGKK
jgi:nicotinic acid phosphoribosyltransferase